MAPKTITVKCPQCQNIYIDWHTPALNAQSAKQATTACSKCGHRSLLSNLRNQSGVWQI